MFSLLNKRNKNTIHDLVSRSKYFLEKELFLKGIIHEEVFLKEEYKEVYENLPKVCHENLSCSPFYKLVSDLKSMAEIPKKRNPEFINREDGSVDIDWGILNNIIRTEESSEVFVDSMSIKLNVQDIEKYHIVLHRELKEAQEFIGLYKSSWGYLTQINLKIKSLEDNIEFLKRYNLFKDSLIFSIRLVIEFNFMGSGSVDIEKHYFKVELLNEKTDQNIHLNTKECLKLIELRNWGVFIKKDLINYLEINEDGIHPGKQNHKLFINTEDELDIDISNLDVN